MNIYAYKMASESAKLLAKALNCKIIKHEGSIFKGDRKKVVVNWGASKYPDEVGKCKVLNRWTNTHKVVSKTTLYDLIHDKFPVPLYTSDLNEAQKWLDAGLKLNVEDGKYIWDINPDGIFRLHFVGPKQIKAQQKKGNASDVPQATRDMISRTGRELMAFLGLDFGAITVGWVKQTGMFYILAVNTAPSLDSELAVLYANNINLLLRDAI